MVALGGCGSPPNERVGADAVSTLEESLVSGQLVTTYSQFDFRDAHVPSTEISLRIDVDPGTGTSRFFAHNFWLSGGGSGYIGLQTDGDRPYQAAGKIAVFSIWDATSAAAGDDFTWCVPFDGEGVGYSCRGVYEWHEGHAYRLRVIETAEHSWDGYVIDEATGKSTHLGHIHAPSTVGSLTGSSVAFTEYYGPSFAYCAWLPISRVSWGNPTTADGSKVAAWSANTIGSGACQAQRESSGSSPATHFMGSRESCGTLAAGRALHRGHSWKSCDGRFSLAMQADGNLVLYQGAAALWATGTTAGTRAVNQTDGNFVVYDSANRAVWQSHTGPGFGYNALSLQDDGNLVMRNGFTAGVVWSTKTGNR